MNVLVVDDHPIVRRGLMQLLREAPDVERCSEAGSIAEALAVAEREHPDAIVLDLSLGKESGLDFLARLRARGSATPVLVLSMFDEAVYAQRVLQAGAQGFLMKEASADRLVDAVHDIVRGQVVLSRAMQERVEETQREGPAAGVDSLTAKELTILQLIGQGLSSTSIAQAQSRSVKTIEAHRETIKRKLGLHSAAELTRFAALWFGSAGASSPPR